MKTLDDGRPWYAEGLRFQCTGCGRCCTGGNGYAWVSVEEIFELAGAVGLEVDDFGRRYLRRVDQRYALVNGPGGDCVFLVGGKSCAVYDHRPAQCRAFPWWPATLRSPGPGSGPPRAARESPTLRPWWWPRSSRPRWPGPGRPVFPQDSPATTTNRRPSRGR